MALTTTITPHDVAIALGRDVPAGNVAAQWYMWISDALMLIQTRASALEVADEDVDQSKLDYVVREAVAAQVRRPDDATQVTVRVDDASTSKTYRAGSGRVGILDEWWALLFPTAFGDSAAFAIDTAGAVDRRHGHADICSIFFGSSNCSCGAYLTVGQYPLYEGGLLS